MVRGRRKEVIHHLKEEELDDAITDARNVDDAALLQRLCFIKNLYANDTPEEAARRVGVSQATSTRWLNRWNEDGANGLKPAYSGGRPPKLDQEQREDLVEILKAERPWTIDEIQDLIADTYGVDYSRRHVRRMVRSYDIG